MGNSIDLGFPNLETTHPTLFRYANSKARIRIVIGPAGSAKTSFTAIKILEIACMQHPDVNGVRHSRALIVRNIYKELTTATKASLQIMMSPLAVFTDSEPPRGKVRFPLPDGTIVSMHIDFLAMDSPNAYNTLLGYEPTVVYFDEVNKVEEAAIFAAARRVGRYPSALQTQGKGVVGHCVLGTCNGPIKNSWLHEWSKGSKSDAFASVEKETGGLFFELFRQPPALLRPPTEGGEWKPNPEAENVNNLQGGYNYYYEMLVGGHQEIQAFVEGDWADLPVGKRVFSNFDHIHQIKKAKVTGVERSSLFLGFDYGRTPVCLIGVQNAHGGLIIVDEVVGEGMGMSTLYNTLLLPRLQKNYSESVIAAAWGDPAGFTKDNSGESSPVSVLAAHGIEVGHPGTNNIEPRLEVVRRALSTLNSRNQPMLLVADNCKLLLEALYSTYVYEVSKLAGDTKDMPTKSHKKWVSDLADALQYLCLGYFNQFKLSRPSNGALPAKKHAWV